MNLKNSLAFIALVIHLNLISSVVGKCEDPWVAVGTKCVHVNFELEPMTWWESRDYCASLSTSQGNGMLAAMPDCLDFAELTYYMGYVAPKEGSFWVGAHTEFIAHNWKWMTMEPLRTGVPFWAYTEGHGDGEECAAVESKYNYQLADDDCEALKGAVCMTDQGNTAFNRFERSYEIVDCPYGSTQVGNHCYHFGSSHHHEGYSWYDANNKCKYPYDHGHSNPGEMFSPSTCEEFSHMAHHLETQGNTKYWVGATDTTGYNEWAWVSGDTIPSGAPYWAYDEPSLHSDGQARHHCAYMDPSKRRYLNDDKCSYKHNYICEVFTS